MSSVDFDDVLMHIGERGRYQHIMYYLLCIPATLPAVFLAFSQVFVSASPDHWCRVPSLNHALIGGLPLTPEQQRNVGVPSTLLADGSRRYDRCLMYDVNLTDWLVSQNVTSDLPAPDPSWPTTKCSHGWHYDRRDYDNTLVTQTSDRFLSHSAFNMGRVMIFLLVAHIVNIVFSQRNFTSQHWSNGSTEIVHGTPEKTNIKIRYSPHTPNRPLFKLHYFNVNKNQSISEESTREPHFSISDDNISGSSLFTNSGDEAINESDLNASDLFSEEIDNNTCCDQANEYLLVKQSLKQDIDDYINKIEELNEVIKRLNTTIRVLEHDLESRNRELRKTKMLKLRRFRCSKN